MRSILIAISAASLLTSTSAQAGDLGHAHDGHQLQQVYATGAALRQFYVRADLGIARHSFEDFSQADLAENGGAFLSKSIGDSPTIGVGFGWQAHNRFRFDLTGEYRATAHIQGLDHVSANLIAPVGTLIANTQYQGHLAAMVGLLNGYWDIGTWRGITPYVGGGVGFARTQVSGLTTLSTATFTDATGAVTTQVSPGTSSDKSQLNFAWALMAGLSFDIGTGTKLDMGYRYLNMGSDIAATSGLLNCVCGATGQPLKIGGLEAHEIRIGLRVPLGTAAYETSASSLK
jgi:opacity protein-like surface antigen